MPNKPLIVERTCQYCMKVLTPFVDGGYKYHDACKKLARQAYHRDYWHVRTGKVATVKYRDVLAEYMYHFACPICGIKCRTYDLARKCCEELSCEYTPEPYYSEEGYWLRLGEFVKDPEMEAMVSSSQNQSQETTSAAPVADFSRSMTESSLPCEPSENLKDSA